MRLFPLVFRLTENNHNFLVTVNGTVEQHSINKQFNLVASNPALQATIRRLFNTTQVTAESSKLAHVMAACGNKLDTHWEQFIKGASPLLGKSVIDLLNDFGKLLDVNFFLMLQKILCCEWNAEFTLKFQQVFEAVMYGEITPDTFVAVLNSLSDITFNDEEKIDAETQFTQPGFIKPLRHIIELLHPLCEKPQELAWTLYSLRHNMPAKAQANNFFNGLEFQTIANGQHPISINNVRHLCLFIQGKLPGNALNIFEGLQFSPQTNIVSFVFDHPNTNLAHAEVVDAHSGLGLQFIEGVQLDSDQIEAMQRNLLRKDLLVQLEPEYEPAAPIP